MTTEVVVILAGVLTVLITQTAQIMIAIINKRVSIENRDTLKQVKQTTEDSKHSAHITNQAMQEVKIATQDTQRTAENTKQVVDEVKATTDTTHTIVNSQKEKMEENIITLEKRLSDAIGMITSLEKKLSETHAFIAELQKELSKPKEATP